MLNPSVALECYFLLREKSPHPNLAWQEDTRQGSKIKVSSPQIHTSHLFSQARCLHSYKQSIRLKVLISSTCVPREINQMRRNGCVASDTSFQHSFPTCPHQRRILSDLPQLPTQLCHQDPVSIHTFPISFPTASHLASSPLTSAMPLPSPHPLPALRLRHFDTPALRFCDDWNGLLMPGGFNLKFTCLQVCVAPSVCRWTTSIGTCTFIHAFFHAFPHTLLPSLPLSYLPWSFPS